MPMAVVAGTGWVDVKDMFKYGGLMALLSIVILAFVGYPIAAAVLRAAAWHARSQSGVRRPPHGGCRNEKPREVRSTADPAGLSGYRKRLRQILSLDIMIKGISRGAGSLSG